MAKQPRTITVTLKDFTGYVRDAIVPVITRIGPFVVHHTPLQGARPHVYTVTHAATCALVDEFIPSLAAARSLARRLVESGANWHFSDKSKMSKRTKQIGIAVRDRWREAQRQKAGGEWHVRGEPLRGDGDGSIRDVSGVSRAGVRDEVGEGASAQPLA